MEYRCHCDSLLFKGFVVGSLVEIKCRRCGRLNVFGEQLSPSETKYFVVVYGDDGSIIECSTTASSVLGYTREELLALKAFDIGVGTTPERYRRTWDIAQTTKFSPVAADARLRTKSGDIIEARVKMIFSNTGKRRYAFCVGEVLCQKKAGEEGSDCQLSSDSVQIEDLIAQIDAEGKFVYGSERFLGMLGYDSEEFIGLDIFNIYRFKRDDEAVRKDIRRLMRQHRPFHIPETGFLTKDGLEVFLDVHYAPAFTDNNRFKGYKLIYSFLTSVSGEK